jgi:hypothetical protein
MYIWSGVVCICFGMWQGPPGLPHCWNGCVSVVPAFWQCGLVQGCGCVLGGVGFAAFSRSFPSCRCSWVMLSINRVAHK